MKARKAAEVALKAVIDFLESGPPLAEVVFVLYDQKTYDVYEDALRKLVTELA